MLSQNIISRAFRFVPVSIALQVCVALAIFLACALRSTSAEAQSVEWTNFQYFSAKASVNGQCYYTTRRMATRDSNGNVVVVGGASGSNQNIVVSKFSATGDFLWRKTYVGRDDYQSCGTAVVVDSNGDVFATGYLGHQNSLEDMIVMKLNGSTGAIIWTYVYAGKGRGLDIALDSAGNPVVVGDAGVTKLNGASGAVAWQSPGSGSSGQNILVDTANDAYIRGYYGIAKLSGATGATVWALSSAPDDYFNGGLSFDGQGNVVWLRTPEYGSNRHTFVSKYRMTTGTAVWEKSLNGYFVPTSPSADALGNLFITGRTIGPNQIAIRTLRLNGSTGDVDWDVSLGSTMDGQYYGTEAIADASGNVLVIGGKLITSQPNGARDYGLQLFKYAGATGATLWSNTIGGTGSDLLENEKIAGIDADGSLKLAASFYGYGYDREIRAIKIDAVNGNMIWSAATNTTESGTSAYGIAADAAGNAFTVTTESELGAKRVRVDKYSPSGASLWTTAFPKTDAQSAIGVKTLPGGDAVIALFEHNNDTNQRVIVFNGATGAITWNLPFTLPANGSISDFQVDASGGIYIVARSTTECAVARLDAADGHEVWRQSFSNAGGIGSAQLAVAPDGKVLLACAEVVQEPSRRLRTIKIDAATGTAAWNVTTAVQDAELMGVAFGGAGDVFVLAATLVSTAAPDTLLSKHSGATGALVWQSVLPGGGRGWLIADAANDAFALTTRNYHQLTKFSGGSGSPIWTTPLAGSTYYGTGRPLLNSAGDIFTRTVSNYGSTNGQAVMYKIRGSDGIPLWQIGSPEPYDSYGISSMAIGPGTSIYIAGMGQEVGRAPAGYVRKILDTPAAGLPIDPLLAIRFTGAGGGTVSVSGQGANCISACSKVVPAGTTVVLKAVANGNSQFDGWTGGGCSGIGDCTTTISASTTVTANFRSRIYTLNVVKTGNGSGRIVSDSSTIDCGATCSGMFAATALFPTLTATPDSGSQFVRVTTSCLPLTPNTPDGCIQAGASSVTLSYDFTAGDFTVSIDFFNPGRIVSTPAGIDCSSSCSYKFPAGTVVTLRAIPTERQVFVAWAFVYGLGQCIQQTADTCTVNAGAIVRSRFDLKPANVTVVKTGGGSGTVTSQPAGIDCGPTCTASLPYVLPTHVLTATPAPGSLFAGFTGCQYSSPTCDPFPYVTSTVEARFELASVALPSAPRQVQAFPGDRQATFHFLPPLSTGLAPISYHQVRCQPGDIVAQSQVSPIRVNDLVNGTQYACTLTAVNKFGPSAAASFDITPSATAAFSFVAAKSQKMHKQDFTTWTGDIDIDLTKAIADGVTVEPRIASPNHTVIFQFSDRVNATGSVSVKDASGVDVGLPSVSIVNNDVWVSLANIPDGKRVTVSLTGVNDALNATASIGFLVGDVDGNGRIDAADLAAIRTRAGQRVFNPSNLRYDLNLSGYVTASDVLVVKRRQGSTLQ